MAYSRKSVFEKPSRAVFEAVAEERGKTFTVTRENAGAWNECRVWTCDGVVVETAMKGTSPDWGYMTQWCVK